MRTFEEIEASANHAVSVGDIEAIHGYAVEMGGHDTPLAQSLSCGLRGWVTVLRGDYALALEYNHRILAQYEELGVCSGVARIFSNIGTVYHRTCSYPAALENFRRALAMYEELDDRTGVASATGNIGNVYARTGDYPMALEHYHRTLSVFEELGDRGGMAGTMCNIGLVLASTGEHSAALECYHRSLALCIESNHKLFAANVTSNIGIAHRRAGEYAQALEYDHRALAMYEELGDRHGVASVSGNIVSVYLGMGSDAEAQARQAVMESMQIDVPGVRILSMVHRGMLQERSGDLEAASLSIRQALSEALEHGLREQAAFVHKRLRDLALKQNDLAKYVEHNSEFALITEEINGKESALKIAMQAKQREIDAKDRETQKQLAVLHATLPKHVADRMARGELVNDQFDSATVIFLDIVGFTGISDRIPSGHVVHLLEQIFTILDAVCDRHNVVKIKTIGDSYMAVSFESAANAASCALDMIASLDALEIAMPPDLGDTSWTRELGDIKVRIGMHCGPVTAGVIGTARMQYDVWGDTVNVASRMENTSEPGRIHISEALARLLNEEHVVPRGSLEIKGKGTMTTYWLEGDQS